MQNYLVTNLEEKTNKKLNDILADPQSLNAYSYAKNNPIIYVDPTGNIILQRNQLIYNITGGPILSRIIGLIWHRSNEQARQYARMLNNALSK